MGFLFLGLLIFTMGYTHGFLIFRPSRAGWLTKKKLAGHYFSKVLLFGCSIVQMFYCSIVRMFGCSIVRMLRCSIVRMFNHSIIQMFNFSSVRKYDCFIPHLNGLNINLTIVR
jgi:hypothetical protein